MRTLIFILLAYIPIHIFAQSKTLYLIDKDSKQAIAFASLYYETSKISFMSNEMGWVQITTYIDKEAILLHHISYESAPLFINNIPDTLYLEKKSYELPIFNYQNLSAKSVIKKAIEAIPQNYIQETHYLKGNYLQVHKENGIFVRYIEAKVDIQNEGLHPNLAKNQEENFAILALRKSYNYEKNGEQHGDHLKDLLQESPIQYLEKHYLNVQNLDLYEWTFLENESDTYQIHFQSKTTLGSRSYKGILSINMENFAIIKLRIESYPILNQQKNIASSWIFINGWYEAQFTQSEMGYYLLNCAQWYHHQIIEPNQDWHPIIEEKFEWTSEELHKNALNKNYSKFSSLYSLSMAYEEEIWRLSFIPSDIRKDLEIKHSLEYQFRQP